MTEQKWLRLKKSWPMLKYLRGKVSDRKLWLFVAAFWRNASITFSERICQLVTNVIEQVADESDPSVDYRAVIEAIYEERDSFVEVPDYEKAAHIRDFRDILFPDEVIERWRRTGWDNTAVLHAALLGTSQRGFLAARWVSYFDSHSLSGILRDIMGSPFHSVALNPVWLSWHGGLLVSMARQMYDSRDFSDLPVLADALEEAGCANQEMLSHCRQQGGVHVRGCWVVDLLLGKE
jgi:hypothetical protein